MSAVYRGNMPLVIHQFRLVHSYHSLTDISLCTDSIKIGRGCSSDVYMVLCTKANIIYDGLCNSREPLIIILVHAPNSAMWLLL